jgi:NAD(P)-dependent dehydrogenase (short-subunit alcohol dehydrogenase family)
VFTRAAVNIALAHHKIAEENSSMSHPSIAALTPDFSGKVVFITGAGMGFGRHFAQVFSEAGATVAVTDINLASAHETAALVTKAGGKAIALRCDVADENEVKAAVAETEKKFGGVDILINNAGLHLTKYNQPFGVLGTMETRRLMDVNVMGVIFCSLACRDSMARRGNGAIVNISSIAGHLTPTPYGVSKLAVRGLTIAFASEFKEQGIRVNAISPGIILSEAAAADLPKDLLEKYLGLQQVKRHGALNDITSAAMFLCSPAAGFITGETLMVSGGYPMQI